MKRWHLWLAMALLLGFMGHTHAQQGKAEPQRGHGGGSWGVGVQWDLGALWAAVRGATRDNPDDIPGHIVAVWDASAALDPATLATSVQGELLASHELPAVGLQAIVLRVPTTHTPTALETLRTQYPDATFGPQRVYVLWGPAGDATGAVHYALALLHAPSPPPPLPAPVRIGIVDGWPDPSIGLHASAIALLPLVAEPAGADHATAVACILACAPMAGLGGMARGAHLVFAAVLHQDGSGRLRSDTITVARALDALLSRGVDIINISLGSAPDSVLQRVVERVLPRVGALVAAGGNAGPNGRPPFPATHPGVIAVAAVDADGQPWSHGTRGGHIAVAAPGVDLWLPVGGGRYFSGTSYAAPFVTAALATLRARGKPIGLDVLCAWAIDLPPAGRDDATGCGLLQWPAAGPARQANGAPKPTIEKSSPP